MIGGLMASKETVGWAEERAIRSKPFKCRLRDCFDPTPHQHSNAYLLDKIDRLEKAAALRAGKGDGDGNV
jgi:hypothetical protein